MLFYRVFIVLLLVCSGDHLASGRRHGDAHCFLDSYSLHCVGGYYRMQDLSGWYGKVVSLRNCAVTNLNCATLPSEITYLDLTGSSNMDGHSCKTILLKYCFLTFIFRVFVFLVCTLQRCKSNLNLQGVLGCGRRGGSTSKVVVETTESVWTMEWAANSTTFSSTQSVISTTTRIKTSGSNNHALIVGCAAFGTILLLLLAFGCFCKHKDLVPWDHRFWYRCCCCCKRPVREVEMEDISGATGRLLEISYPFPTHEPASTLQLPASLTSTTLGGYHHPSSYTANFISLC